jgi:hypothetical protein
MFIRKTSQLQLGKRWFRVPEKDECPSAAITQAMSGTDYVYASIRARRIPAHNSLESGEILERIEKVASGGPFIFYVFHGLAFDPRYSYIKVGYARTLQHAKHRRQFRIKRDALAFQKEGIALRWLCAVPVNSEKDAKWLEQSFENTFGTLCQRLLEDQDRRSGLEFYQPTDLATKLGEGYPAPA